MRNVSEISISALLTTTMVLVYVPLVYLNGDGYQFMSEYDFTDWCVGAGLGLTGVYSQIFRAKAVHYEEPARLTVLNYFQPVI